VDISHAAPCAIDTRDVDAWSWRIEHGWGGIAYEQRGRAYRAIGFRDQAIADYTEAIRASPAYAVPLCGRAGVFADKRDFDRALADYTAALALAEDHPLALIGRGYIRLLKGEWETALSDLSDLADKEKADAAAPFGCAIAWEKLGNPQLAIRCYTRTIANDPRNAAAHLSRGALYAKQGESEKANADFRTAIRQRPILAMALAHKGPGYVLNGEWDSLAGALFQQKQVYLALSQWRAALRSHPTAPGMVEMAAWVMAAGPCQFHNTEEAIELAQRGVELTGARDAAFLDTLAVALSESDRMAQTGPTAEKALALAKVQENEDLVEQILEQIRTYRLGRKWFDKDIVNEPQ
jgi:tetratricopeptide (TPR) repeat protein